MVEEFWTPANAAKEILFIQSGMVIILCRRLHAELTLDIWGTGMLLN